MSSAFAADFPEGEVRDAEVRAKLLQVGSLVGQRAGRGAKFDPANALAACDGIDRDHKEKFARIRQARLKARELAASNSPGWDQELRKALLLKEDPRVSLADALSEARSKWSADVKEKLPCSDEGSLSLIEVLASDRALADDPPFNFCVRLVKSMRRSGGCSDSPPVKAPVIAVPVPQD